MRKIVIYIILTTYLISFPNYADPIYAQTTPTTNPASGLGCGGGLGPIADLLCRDPSRETVGTKLNTTLSMIIGFLTTVAGLWFIFQFIVAGYQWINSAGDKTSLEAARKKITHAIIGILIVVSAWVIIAILGTILGLDILNPGQIIQGLGL